MNAEPSYSVAARLVALPIQAYRLFLSPWVGHNCRFQPTCSCYALEALERHGAMRGTYLTVRRLARCQPFGASGFDPVPPVEAPANKADSQKHV
ncbi:membrane protein insertion efficiency factor YidD [Ferrovibrio sp.]|uniref:membrane protein insertion efficiency factor YidD n=1 Tax=Ferrovibrio sp. TaxID=1917215 RepID=UPI003D138008